MIDSVFNKLPFTIQAGDKMVFEHPCFFGYPFEYTFTEDFVLTKNHSRISVQSPYHSRLMLTGIYESGVNNMSAVIMSWNPMDFRRVWSSEEHAQGNYGGTMQWAKLFVVNATRGHNIRHTVMSRDGDAAYAAVSYNDTANNCYYILRARGLNEIELNDTNSAANTYFNFLSPNSQLIKDTLKFNGVKLFKRPITSLTVDQRDGKDCLIVTFGGFDGSEPNVIVFDNASGETYTAADKSVGGATIPAYSSMVEYTTGQAYIGTEDGVFVASDGWLAGTPDWQPYGEFKGVIVTSMHQQTDTLKSTSLITHNGINVENNVFAKTKYPYAMYFGTYGRGVFVDMKYVTDKDNNIVDPSTNGIREITSAGETKVSVYPNPASAFTTVDLTVAEGANTTIKVYDMSGKLVMTQDMGRIDAGNHKRQINCQGLHRGVYLVNVMSGKTSTTTKLVVR